MAQKKSIPALQRDFQNRLTEAGEFYIDEMPGFLGNYSGVVSVPNSNGKVYVRLEGSGQVVQAVNTVAPNIPNWAVYVGRDKSQPTVLRILRTRWVWSLRDMSNYTVYHHGQHEFPGADTVFVHRDQFMPLLVSPAGGLSVKLYGDVIYQAGMTRFIRVPDQVIDLSGELPITGARYVVLEVTPAGTINLAFGSTRYSREDLTINGELPAPTEGNFPIAAVVLALGQTSIRQDRGRRDILDLRMFTSSAGDAHTHSYALDDLSDVDAAAPTEGQVLTWDDTASEWIAQDAGGGVMVEDDLSSQATGSEDHFDLSQEAIGGGMLMYNGVFQSPDHYTMDVDGLGLTTDFFPDIGDSLWFIYNVSGVVTVIDDPDAIHIDVADEYDTASEKTTAHNDDRVLIEDQGASFVKKWIKRSNLLGTILDALAIHISTADEFDTASEKTTIHADDRLLIEDSQASYAKKWAKRSNVVGSASGLVFISETTASGAATLSITSGINSTYDEYVLRVELTVATDAVGIRMLVSTNGGSSWIATGYKHALSVTYSNGFGANVNSDGTTEGYLVGEVGNAAGEVFTCEIQLRNPNSASNQKHWVITGAHNTQHPYHARTQGDGGNTTTSAINALQFKATSGNITGRVRLYGVQKA